jgi:aspartyl-tRNA(Asn)/glutamyl-tRNA(Gln) amidotransferase subunit A
MLNPMSDASSANRAELCFSSAARLAGMIARREVSPVEVVDAVLERAERLQPVLNMFAVITADAARTAARTAEAQVMRAEALGPLHGVPITIKDNLPVGGLPMRNGSAAFADFVPSQDAAVVTRVRQAGAIPIGKTNLPEFAHKVLTDGPLFGVTRNPWSLAHTPGGSSGGGSAALAAGVAPIAIGTDGGGSIRCPAACTGTAGIKATLGRIPFETFPDGFANYAFVGPMTRVVEDLPLMLSVMAGSHEDDPYSLAAGPFTPGPRRETVAGLRVAWIDRFGDVQPDAEVAAATSRAVKTLADHGAHVETPLVPELERVFDTYVVIATTAHAARLEAIAAKFGDRLSDSIRQSISRGLTYSAADWQRAHDQRTVLFRAVQRLFERFDLIVTPTMTTPAKTVDAGGSIATDMYADWAGYLYPFNLTGHPAMSLPCGFSAAGLPIGLQLIGSWFGEHRMLDVALMLEESGRWSERRPPL